MFGADRLNQFDFDVVQAARIDTPLDMILHDNQTPHHFIVTLTPECVGRCLQARVVGSLHTVGDRLEYWRQMQQYQGLPSNPNGVLRLKHPICSLIAAGSWTSLAFDGRHRCTHNNVLHSAWSSLKLPRQIPIGDIGANVVNSEGQ